MSTEHEAPTAADGPSNKKAKKSETPHDLFFEELDAVVEKNKGIGQILIKGLPRNYDEDDDEEEDTSKFTTEEMKSLRFVIVTQERADMLEEMEKFVLGDQHGHSIMMFNTSFSYGVLDGYELFKSTYGHTKSWPKKFDMLFAYTHTLMHFDVWMHDHEVGWGGEVFLKNLAMKWKALLKKADQELGIDTEFTRPGVACFLKKFQDAVESIETYDDPAVTFKFQ